MESPLPHRVPGAALEAILIKAKNEGAARLDLFETPFGDTHERRFSPARLERIKQVTHTLNPPYDHACYFAPSAPFSHV